MCVQLSVEARRGRLIPWSDRLVWTTMWVLKTKLLSPARAVGMLTPGASSSSQLVPLNTFYCREGGSCIVLLMFVVYHADNCV